MIFIIFQVSLLLQCFETCAEDLDIVFLSTFRKLKAILKIITLHQPSDILRYNSTFYEGLSEEQIRSIMRCRKDFSSDAVSRIKFV